MIAISFFPMHSPRFSRWKIFAVMRVDFALCCALGTSAQTSIQFASTNLAVTHASMIENVPAKPAAMVNVPLARLEYNGDPQFSSHLLGYLTDVFKAAQRPRITEGEKFDFTIRTTVERPPELTELKHGGSKFNPAQLARSVGKVFGGPKLDQIPEFVDFTSTNIIVIANCEVVLKLLDNNKEVLEQERAQITLTNTLRNLSMELTGFQSSNAGENVTNFLRNLKRSVVQEALVDLTTYHAATNFLVKADKSFLAFGNSASVAESKPSVKVIGGQFGYLAEQKPVLDGKLPIESKLNIAPKGDQPVVVENKPGEKGPENPLPGAVQWLTPKQVADQLQMTEADVIKMIEKGDLKAKKFGPAWRISAKELQAN